MNLAELRTFLAIVETGSLVRASARLHVTQSTVTARLKSLEDELGQTLLNRNKAGVTLTAAGVRFHRYADTISDLWRQARQETALPDGMSGICNLACDGDLWPHLGERFFRQLQETHPEVAMSVWLGNPSEVARWLNEGKSDLVISYHSSISKEQGQIALPDEQLVLVSTRPDSPIRFDPDYVFVEAGDDFGRQHAVAYADAGTARISFGNAVIGLEYLLRAGGSAYLPQRLVSHLLETGRLFRLAEGPIFTRSVYLNYNLSARQSWPWFDAIVEACLGDVCDTKSDQPE